MTDTHTDGLIKTSETLGQWTRCKKSSDDVSTNIPIRVGDTKLNYVIKRLCLSELEPSRKSFVSQLCYQTNCDTMVKISAAALSALAVSSLIGGASAFTTLKSQAARQPATLLAAVRYIDLSFCSSRICFHLEGKLWY